LNDDVAECGFHCVVAQIRPDELPESIAERALVGSLGVKARFVACDYIFDLSCAKTSQERGTGTTYTEWSSSANFN
jgi:hypothetical protein